MKKILESQTLWRIILLVSFVALIITITYTGISLWLIIPGGIMITSGGLLGYADKLYKLNMTKNKTSSE